MLLKRRESKDKDEIGNLRGNGEAHTPTKQGLTDKKLLTEKKEKKKA